MVKTVEKQIDSFIYYLGINNTSYTHKVDIMNREQLRYMYANAIDTGNSKDMARIRKISVMQGINLC